MPGRLPARRCDAKKAASSVVCCKRNMQKTKILAPLNGLHGHFVKKF
jgi:hypothetical protein